MSGGGKRSLAARYGFAALVWAGVLLRIWVVAVTGQELRTPWSGGSDAPAYVLLAENLIEGKGLSYAGQPSAFRPPAYPLLLAGLMRFFGNNYVVAVRWLQFAAGLATVAVCAAAGARLFGEEARKPAAALGLFLPTLVWTTGEVLTENIAALLAAVFLYFLLQEMAHPRWANTAALGLTAGIAALFRYNMAALVLVGLWVTLSTKGIVPRWQRATLLLALAALVVSPWVVRNYLVFRGEALFSTQGGAAAALGIITPQGRSQPGETQMLRQALGWVPPQDLETNGADRTRLPGEPELNRKAWRAARQQWGQAGWESIPLVLAKWASFWLSTDQVFSAGSFSLRKRLVRDGGVLAHWVALALGIAGWIRLRTSFRGAAAVLLFYAALLTVLHSVFTMNTRLRIPFMDPMLVILAAGGWLVLLGRAREGAAGARLQAVGGGVSAG